MASIHEVHQTQPFRVQQEELDQRLLQRFQIHPGIPDTEFLGIALYDQRLRPGLDRMATCGPCDTIKLHGLKALFNEVPDLIPDPSLGKVLTGGNTDVHRRALEPFQHDGE